MKAWVLHNINDLRFEEVPVPKPQNGEVLVNVKCAGVCSSDVSRVFSTGSYNYPIILGHEFSGETADGRRVAVFPLIPCFECDSCKSGIFETCSSYSYIGSRRNGAFAEYVAVPEWNLIEIPNHISFEQAALIEPAAVALHAVNKADLSRVRNAAVIGDGIIGKLIAKWLDIEGILDVKLLGRNDSDENIGTFDLCFEAVGSRDALKRCVDHVRSDGQIVLVGNPDASFNMDRDLYWQLLRKQITVKGTWNSRYPHEWQKALKHADKLKLNELISHRIPFEKAGEALVMMKEKSANHCKVEIIINREL